MVNKVGKRFGLTFTGVCAKNFEFLDAITSILVGIIKTTMFIKPTDACRYLNRSSFHSKHTFTGMPYSQYRRAAVICSDIDDRKQHILRMERKFVDSGFKEHDLKGCHDRAMALDRNELLMAYNKPKDSQGVQVVTCVINQDPDLKRELNKFFREYDQQIKRALGDVKLVVSERRHANISSLLFQKRGFSQNVLPILDSQKCSSTRCKTRHTMNIESVIHLNGKKIRLDYRFNCGSDSVIYLGICKHCKSENFYFGQTINVFMCRCNGHRDKFKLDRYEKSALSMHIMDKHPEHFNKKLDNFDFGIVKSVNPMDLNRAEDCLIFITKADTVGLNRYKCSK